MTEYLLLQFVGFLERLSRTLNMDELTQDIGIELHTEAIIHRAEQLARLESDKIVDKVSRCMSYKRPILIHFSVVALVRSQIVRNVLLIILDAIYTGC